MGTVELLYLLTDQQRSQSDIHIFFDHLGKLEFIRMQIVLCAVWAQQRMLHFYVTLIFKGETQNCGSSSFTKDQRSSCLVEGRSSRAKFDISFSKKYFQHQMAIN
jgi:hypothetical protein